MAKYRSAMGQVIDMEALAAKNELIRAVSNRSVNARGDLIDETGKIIKPATELANESYTKTLGNKSAQVTKPSPNKQKIVEELSPAEQELEESLEDDIEIEKIKAQENKK